MTHLQRAHNKLALLPARTPARQLDLSLAVPQRQLAELQARNITLVQDRKSLKRKVEALEKDNVKLREKETSLGERVKMLTRFRSSLEQENKTLMTQLNKLLLQNQELLFKTMTSKDRLKSTEAQFQETVRQRPIPYFNCNPDDFHRSRTRKSLKLYASSIASEVLPFNLRVPQSAV